MFTLFNNSEKVKYEEKKDNFFKLANDTINKGIKGVQQYSCKLFEDPNFNQYLSDDDIQKMMSTCMNSRPR